MRTKGYSETARGSVRVYKCKQCGRHFRKTYARSWVATQLPSDIWQSYLNNKVTIAGLKSMLGVNVGKSTLNRAIIRQLKQLPTWKDLIKDPAREAKWGYIMGMDTTSIKIGGKKYVYLHVADIPSREHLAYTLLTSEDCQSIKNVLLALKEHYEPKIVVVDLAKEILKAVREVFPDAIVQGCLFHLKQWLNKQLPTKKAIKICGLKGEMHKIHTWLKIKNLIMCVALSWDENRQAMFINQLRGISISQRLDKRAQETVEHFFQNLDFYNPLYRIVFAGGAPRFLYNNICERAMRSVKELGARMGGFKKLENAKLYINGFWFLHSNVNAQKEAHVPEWQAVLSFFFAEMVELNALSEATGVSAEALRNAATKAGLIVTQNHAFNKQFFDEAIEKILQTKPKNVGEAAKMLGLSLDVAAELLSKRFKLCFPNTLDVANATICYTVTNETEH